MCQYRSFMSVLWLVLLAACTTNEVVPTLTSQATAILATATMTSTVAARDATATTTMPPTATPTILATKTVSDVTPTSTNTPPPLPQVPTVEIVSGHEVFIDSLEIMITNAEMPQVFVTVEGTLAYSCVTLNGIVATRSGNSFTINFNTRRESLTGCRQVTIPFSEQVELIVSDLSGGSYTVTGTNPDGAAVTETFLLLTVEATAVAPAMSELLTECFIRDEQNGVFISLQDGYCLQYPVVEGATVHNVLATGAATIWGRRLTFTFEPVRAGVRIFKRDAANGRSLDEMVAEILGGNSGATLVGTTTFAGEPTQIVEGIEGPLDSRRYFLLHSHFLYEIVLMPLTPPNGYEDVVVEQRNLLWQTVSETFIWLPRTVTEQFSFCPIGDQENSSYINPQAKYCLLYPLHFSQQNTTVSELTSFGGPIEDPTNPAPSQVSLQVMTEATNGRSLSQVINEIVATAGGIEVVQSEGGLGGETAVILTGLSGNPISRDLYTIRQDIIYHLHLEPTGFEQIIPDMTLVWDTVLESFTFFP